MSQDLKTSLIRFKNFFPLGHTTSSLSKIKFQLFIAIRPSALSNGCIPSMFLIQIGIFKEDKIFSILSRIAFSSPIASVSFPPQPLLYYTFKQVLTLVVILIFRCCKPIRKFPMWLHSSIETDMSLNHKLQLSCF